MASKDIIDKTLDKWDETYVQESKKKIRKKIIFLLAGVILLAGILAVAVYLMLSSYQKSVVNGQVQQMVYLVQSVTNSIEEYVDEYEVTLNVMLQDPVFLEAEEACLAGEAEEMEGYLKAQQNLRSGTLGLVGYRSPDGRQYVSEQPEEYSEIRQMTNAANAVQLALVQMGEKNFYLKISAETSGGGNLGLFLSIRSLYEKTASYISLGEEGYIMLKTSDGRILTHPAENQIGMYVIKDRQKEHPEYDLTELQAMVEKQLAGETGTAMYASYWWPEDPPRRVRKVSAYQPAHLGDDFLIVSAVIDYDEISLPVSNGVIRILVVAGFLGALLIMLLALLAVLWRSMNRFQAENAYLRKLNEQLEELRAREEKLAHQQRLQLLGTMTGGIAHEFNNLLTPIMGYSAMLLMDAEEGSEQKQDLQEIYDSAEKAKEIIDQLSRFSGKNAEKTFRSIPIAEVVDKAMLMVESICPKSVTLDRCLEKTEVSIMGNPTQIHQLLLNLCNNAFYAMKDTVNARLILESHVVKGEKKMNPFFKGKEKQMFYRLSVRDNGCGMSPETLEQIYVPFFTTKKAGEGTGLGLSVVHRIIDAHGGLLCVTSQPGEGTEFVIWLPVHIN